MCFLDTKVKAHLPLDLVIPPNVFIVMERISTLSVECLSSMWLQQLDILINVHNGTTYVTLGHQVCMHNAVQMMTSCVSVTCGVQTVNASPDFGADSTDVFIFLKCIHS